MGFFGAGDFGCQRDSVVAVYSVFDQRRILGILRQERNLSGHLAQISKLYSPVGKDFQVFKCSGCGISRTAPDIAGNNDCGREFKVSTARPLRRPIRSDVIVGSGMRSLSVRPVACAVERPYRVRIVLVQLDIPGGRIVDFGMRK